jgi:hypothetical protein
MPSALHQRCIVALLLAFWSACAAALMAWGTIELPHNSVFLSVFTLRLHVGGSPQDLGTWLAEPLIWAGIGLLGLALWGQRVFAHGRRRATDLSWPWRALLMASSCHAAWWVLQTLTLIEHTVWSKQLSQASVGVFLFLGVMAEGVDARWGQARAVLAGFGVVALGALACLFGEHGPGMFDARVLLLLQILPLLLIPAGAFGLSNPWLCRGECLFMCVVYSLTLATNWLPMVLSAQMAAQGGTGSDALWFALPWGTLAALCLLLLMPIGRALQSRSGRGPGDVAVRQNSVQPSSLPRFALEAPPIPNRRSSS